jgi:copper(I)-binding protein
VGLFTTLANDSQTSARLLGVSTVYASSVVQRNGLEGPVQSVDVAIPGGGVVSMQYPGGPHLELVGLKTDVSGGRFVPVTFRFGTGSLTVDVFVEGFGLPTVPPSSPAS